MIHIYIKCKYESACQWDAIKEQYFFLQKLIYDRSKELHEPNYITVHHVPKIMVGLGEFNATTQTLA